MVEAFCAEHKLSHEEVLYDWPASRFEAFYQAFTKRTIAEQLTERKHLEIAALWSNPNLDSQEQPNARANAIEKIESSYDQAIEMLYNPELAKKDEIDEDDPFYAAMRRGQEKHKLPSSPIDQLE